MKKLNTEAGKIPFKTRDAEDLRTYLQTAFSQQLLADGCKPWAKDPEDQATTIWLFPGFWFSHIPEGFRLVDIWGQRGVFDSKELQPLEMEGTLAFGFTRATKIGDLK